MAEHPRIGWQIATSPGSITVAITDPSVPRHMGQCIAIVQGPTMEEKQARARLLVQADAMLKACADTQALLTELKMGIGPAALRRKALFARLELRIERILEYIHAEEVRA